MAVKEIQRTGQSVIIEVSDMGVLRRVIVPADEVADNGVSPEVLERGVAYGLPWEELLSLRVTPAIVANALRRSGIWTLEDLRRQPMRAVAALQSAYGLDVAALMGAAETYEKQGA